MRWLRIILLLLIASTAGAASLQWDASQTDAEHPAPEGYRTHWGTLPGSYTIVADAGDSLQWQIPDGRPSGYFVVSAYGTCSRCPLGERECQPQELEYFACESGYSNEVYWVAGDPVVNIGATALTASRYQIEAQQMAAEYISSEAWVSGNITVPADCTAAVVFANFFANASLTAVTIGGQARDAESHTGSSGYFISSVSIFLNPPTGARALALTFSEAPWEGPAVTVVYVKGTSSARDYDTDATPVGDDAVTIDTNATDLVVGFSGNYESYLAAPTGWTSRLTNTNANAYNRVLTCDSPGASTTTLDIGGTAYYTVGAVAFISSAGGTSAVPVFMRQYKARRQ